jgi:hypothetical protein
MLRFIKPLFFCFAAMIVMADCQSALGQMVTYEMGPFHVDGLGATPQEAQSEAYGAMYDLLLDLEANLPEGHVLLTFVIEDQGLTAPDTFEVDFHAVIWIPTPPGPPGAT